jgi:glutaminyl-peptide cyclotransferase
MHDGMISIRHVFSMVALLTLTQVCLPALAGGPAAAKTEIAASSRGSADLSMYGYRIVRSYPHDTAAFTQGLIYHDGLLYESTGLHGRSSLRKVHLKSGKVLARRDLSAKYFGEGIARYGDRIMQLTYRTGIGFIYDMDLRQVGSFRYPTQGWGLTCDGARLILSDGTPTLRWLDPATLRILKEVTVTSRGRPVPYLNELEMVKGEIFANIWQTDFIARISPKTGEVTGWIDLRGLSSEMGTDLKSVPISEIDVLNGIAYDEQEDRLFVTGKFWPKLFEIKLIRK